jgi:hypothetical protein
VVRTTLLRVVPSPTPTRDQNVYFVGAGLSVGLGLPNTGMLLNGVIELYDREQLVRKAGSSVPYYGASVRQSPCRRTRSRLRLGVR